MSSASAQSTGKFVVICGPTSAGKTSTAIRLCKKLGGAIVSADSRQIYKEMDIGTGKMPIVQPGGKNQDNLQRGQRLIEKNDNVWKVDGVNIWGYDLVKPDEYYSVYNFAQFAIPKINELLRSSNVFLVGGTGFYINAVMGNYDFSEKGGDPILRNDLENMGTEDLLELLKVYNQEKHATIDKSNRRRIVRAVEIETIKKTSNGEDINLREKIPQLSARPNIQFGLTAPREVLYSRADNWLDEIWDSGLLEETEYLLTKYPESNKLTGLVYKSCVEFLKTKANEEEIRQRAKYDLHAYIRRQLTWFRNSFQANERGNKEVGWIDISTQNYYEQIIKMIESK